MIFNIGGGRAVAPEPDTHTVMPEFTYTGRYQLINDGKSADGTQNWRIKFLTSGRLRFTKVVERLTVFLVGGGGGGAAGGGGGAGGYTATQNVTAAVDTEYWIYIGSGGAGGTRGGTSDDQYGHDGGATTAFGVTARGGGRGLRSWGSTGTYGGNGASGGGGFGGGNGGADGAGGTQAKSGYPGGSGQGRTTREFGERSGTLYAGGGGGGTYSEWGSVGGKGGAGGGGNAHQSGSENGHSGKANTGGGGGGGWKQSTGTNGGSGGSGIVVLRNRRA